MFKIPGTSAPVVRAQSPLTGSAGPAAVNNTAHPPPLTLAPGPRREGGIECLPMTAWHQDVVPPPARENRRLITRMAAGMLAWVRAPREAAPAEAAPATQAVPAATQPVVNRLGEQPAAHMAPIACFLQDSDLHALSTVAHKFSGIPAANPRFMANKALAERRAGIVTTTQALRDELGKLENKVELLEVINSASTSSSAKIKALKKLDPKDTEASVTTRIKQVEAELEQARSLRQDMQIAMAAEKRAAQAQLETKAGSQTPSSSSSASQDMPMRPDQWAARQRRE